MGTAVDLPDDLLADALRRLPPRGLAVSRCVCHAWRDAVDARRLLRDALLPRSLAGFFLNYCELPSPEFLARRPAAAVSGDLGFIPYPVWHVTDHRNGLLLFDGRHGTTVANPPATRRWARLPPRPASSSMGTAFPRTACLVYDPAASPHYEVVLVPFLPHELARGQAPQHAAVAMATIGVSLASVLVGDGAVGGEGLCSARASGGSHW
ncbi:hypothetical protein ACP4OV_012494 [Aristida adscensionis]